MGSRIAVLGSAQSKHERCKKGQHLTEMIYETVKAALENAGVEHREIGTVVSASSDVLDGIGTGSCLTSESMGAFLKEETRVEDDGLFAAIYAMMYLMADHSKPVLVVAYSKGSQVPGYFYTGLGCDPFYQRPLGLDGHGLAALQFRRYMETYGASEMDAARVAAKSRRNGARNPHALRLDELTLEGVLETPYRCVPLREAMISPETDGACAVVLGAEPVTGRSGNPVAWIEGVGYCTDCYYPGYRDLSWIASAQQAASRAYRAAGIREPLRELDVVEMSACYAHEELMLTEALGFCSKGQGRDLLKEGVTDRHGALPVNPSGGPLCANPIIGTGLIRLAEVALQVTGQAGERQIENARLGLAHGAAGQCLQSNAVVILRGE